MCWARGTKRASPGFASFIAPDLGGNLLTLGQIRHATLEMNDYYPLIARAVERLDRSTGEARRAVYERARKAVAQLRSNQPALLDADITKERLALEEAIRKVEAEAARKSPPETRAEPRSAAPSEGMPDSDKIQTRDHLQPASPDRDDRPPALSSRQAPIFLPTASDDHHNADIQAVAIGGAYGADHYYDDVPGSRWRGGLLIVMAVLALAMLAGTFAYRAFFGGYMFPALPPIVIAGAGPNDIVQNNSDTRRSNSSQTSVTSAGWSEKLQPIDIREAPKTEPRVISNIPISSRPSAGPVALAPAATAAALDPPVASALDQHVAPSVPPPASAPAPVSAPAYRLPRSRARLRRSSGRRASGCAYARSCPAGAYSSTCPTACLGSGACIGFLGAERDWGGRAGCAYARSCPAGAYSSTCPAACLGSGACIGFLGAERDCGGRARLRLCPLLPRRCLQQHLSRRLPRLRRLYRLPRSRARLRRSRRLRLCPLLPRRCLQQHLSRRLPRLRRLYRLPRSRARLRRSHWLRASRVRLRPLLPRLCSRQRRPPRLR